MGCGACARPSQSAAEEPSPCAMSLEESLRRSNARFMATINSILERYNHPFEDDLLISMETLTYSTPDGPKSWEDVSTEDLRKWQEEVFECSRGSERNAEMSKQDNSDFEDGHSTGHQESPETSGVNTSDTGEESDTDTVSVRRKLRDVHLQNLHVRDGKIQEKVKVDVIVQDNVRKIPGWIMRECQGSSKGLHLASPVQELIGTAKSFGGNQAAVCRRKVELSNECSSSRPPQLGFSDVPISTKTITIPRHQTSPELNKTWCDSILEEYQSADEECSWSNVTLADLYPGMLELLARLMTKQTWRKESKYMFGQLRHRRHPSGRPKLNVTLVKIRGFRPPKLKRAQPSICSSRHEDIQNQTFGNENRELRDDKRSINNLSGVVPYSYIDTNEIKMDCFDSSLVPRKGPKVFKRTVFPDVITTMGETFLVEDELQTTVSINPKCKESEKCAYQCPSEYCFVTSAASSGSTGLHPVKESKTQKNYFSCGDTSELYSSTCSSYGNSHAFTPVANCSLARASNTLLINPEKITSGRQIAFEHKHLFSLLSTKQSPSKMPQKYNDAFEKLSYKLCPQEIQKPLTLTRSLANSQNLEDKGRLVKSNLSHSVRSHTPCDREFDRIYEQLCSGGVPKLPGFQRASNLKKYEGVQMSETVNALVNSPVQTLSVSPRVKRLGNFQNDPLCSPVKRLRGIPERYLSSTKCEQIAHRRNAELQTDGMRFLNPYIVSNPSIFDSHNCQSEGSGFHAASDKTFLGVPGTSLQESGIAGTNSGWPSAVKNYSSPRNAQYCRKRVSRKLSYAVGKDDKSQQSLG
ncbi:uncharacterized protein LOC135577518 [Columba livia]|uniref:uncharacterized protein LOC135577518 n=1 Tax=Columba livia TaxID=8932 RepID=UPI0031BB5C50